MTHLANLMTDAVKMAHQKHAEHREHLKGSLGTRQFMRKPARASVRRELFSAVHDPTVAARVFGNLPPEDAEALKRHLVQLGGRPVESLPPWMRPKGD